MEKGNRITYELKYTVIFFIKYVDKARLWYNYYISWLSKRRNRVPKSFSPVMNIFSSANILLLTHCEQKQNEAPIEPSSDFAISLIFSLYLCI